LCLSISVVLTGIASFDEMMCREAIRCAGRGALASIAWLLLAPLAVGTARLGWSLRTRAAVENFDDGWTWSLSALFIAGAWMMVAKIPSRTCGTGYHLDRVAGVCLGRTGGFVAPTSWGLLKVALLVATAVLGGTAIRSNRATLFTSPIAAATWFAGSTWWIWTAFVK
jgi:hypothetical protein